MPHCYTHDIDYPALHECPECRADEAAESRRRVIEQQEEAREDRLREEERQRDRYQETVRLREREIYKRHNPGDYTCPECLYITLKRSASRCPACHAAITQDYWTRMFEVERLQAEEKARLEKLAVEEKARQDALAAEEWAKGEPERQRRAKAAAEEAERKHLEAAEAARVAASELRQAAIGKGIGYLVLGLVVGAIVGFIAAIIIATPVWIVAGLSMNDSGAGAALANNVGRVVTVLGAAMGAWMGWSLGTHDTVLNTKRRRRSRQLKYECTG